MARKPSPRHVKVSKHLSYVLRHAPRAIGLSLDDAGWVDVDTLLDRSRAAGFPIERAFLDEVVSTSEKRRFSFSDDGRRIRANQGHTIEVDLGYAPESPPDVLFHGTPMQTVALVREGGLKKMARHHVQRVGPNRACGTQNGNALFHWMSEASIMARGKVGSKASTRSSTPP